VAIGTSGLVRYRDEPLPTATNRDGRALEGDFGPLPYLDMEAGMRATLPLQDPTSCSTRAPLGIPTLSGR
jgi:hypothetical protein